MVTIFLLMLFLPVAGALLASLVDQGGIHNHTTSRVMNREDMNR